MHLNSTVRTAISSYIGAFSSIAVGLLTIRIATQYLGKEDFGLWSFTTQTVGYLLLLDFGVSSSMSRLFGEPLASGDQQKINSWFTLCLLTLLCQALVILSLGLAARPLILRWFDIPSHLIEHASTLWLAFLAIRTMSLMFVIAFAILHAQNRVFWSNMIQTSGAWAGLLAFALMLWQGHGVMAYGWSTGISALVIILGSLFAVKGGKERFHLSLRDVNRNDLHHLVGFSSTVFVIGLASQVYFASHGLVATKILGLEAAAVLVVTMRVVALANTIIWKPFDAFSPRWQVAYCNRDLPRVTREFSLVARFTILLAASGAIGIAIVNQPFIYWWMKPEFFGGLILNFLLAGFVLVQGINRCFTTIFPLTLHMRGYTIVNLSSVAAAVGMMILFTKWWGLPGIPAGLILTDLLFPLWYYLCKGGNQIGVNGLKLVFQDAIIWIPLLVLSILLAILLSRVRFHSDFLWFVTAMLVATVCAAPLLWRAYGMIRELRHTPT